MAKRFPTITVAELRECLAEIDGDKKIFISVDDGDGETTMSAPMHAVIAHPDYDFDFIELVTVNEGGEWDTNA
jgi:hypothetical protein